MIYNEEEDQNIIDYNNQNRNTIIQEIKSIIKEYGNFGTSDVQASYSPSISNYGSLIHLIEEFHHDNVEVNVYMSGSEIEIDCYTLSYEVLTINNLEYILELAKEFKQTNIENDEIPFD